MNIGIYRHYKGKFYKVICKLGDLNNEVLEPFELYGAATHSETLCTVSIYKLYGDYYHNIESDDVLVLYKALYDDHKLWVRPIQMFSEEVEINGNTVLRFEKM